MRPLFFLLTLINLGYFTWQQQQQSIETPLPHGPIASTPNSNTLTLLSEIHIPHTMDTEPVPRDNALQETPPTSQPEEPH